MDRIQKCGGAPDLFTLIGWLHSMKLVVFFDWDVTVDSQDPSRNLLNLQQGGITLPDPAYYLQPRGVDKVHALQSVAQTVFTLAGVADPARSAADAVAFETLLARGFLSNSKHGIRQVRVSFAAFAHLTQKFDWVSVFAGIGDVAAQWDGMISVDHVSFFEHMSSLVLSQPVEQLRSYMMWRVLKTFAPFMTAPYERAMQTLDHMLLGTDKLESRWRKCLDSSTDSVRAISPLPSYHQVYSLQVPTLLSLVFDTTFLTPSIEYVARLMVSLVRQAFNDTIAQEDWLDQPTISHAQRKLKAALVTTRAHLLLSFRHFLPSVCVGSRCSGEPRWAESQGKLYGGCQRGLPHSDQLRVQHAQRPEQPNPSQNQEAECCRAARLVGGVCSPSLALHVSFS
jgi:predicted metalloendopeptidase